MKLCKKCGEDYEDGLKECPKCKVERDKAWKEANPEKNKEHEKKYRKNKKNIYR